MHPLILLYPGTFVAAVLNPRWGFIGLLTIMLVRPPDRVPELVGFPGIELMLVGIVLGMALRMDSLAKPKVPQDKLILWLLILSVLGLMIQARGEIVSETKEFLSAIVIYVFATRLIRNSSDLLTLLFWLSAVTVVLVIEAIRAYLADPAGAFTDPLSGRMQGLGYYANPNEFGKLMCTAIPFFGIFMFSSRSFFLRLVALGGVLVMLAAVGYTQSRTCFVALAIIAFTPFLLSANKGVVKRLIVMGILGVALLYVVTLLPGPLQERAASITEYRSDSSFQGRLRAWGQGFLMVTWYPLYGVGKGQWYSYHGLAPHNSFVQVMAEMGLPGIVVFCMIVWACWTQVAGYLGRAGEAADPRLVTLSKGIAASYLGYLFYIFLGNQGYSPWTYFYFGICAAFAYITRSVAADARAKRPAAGALAGAAR